MPEVNLGLERERYINRYVLGTYSYTKIMCFATQYFWLSDPEVLGRVYFEIDLRRNLTKDLGA
jgi:hypothetical protein